ncbi:phosphotransferase family protein [Amycolatopsis orientalis]|uniref:phosphotransferase family protein n=1 Tax=Amycolatopsis orientalis TaxID=31958 RepID=UPI00039EC184|nr:phosphotransferase family protein [Amycolatopsis orientalis]
MTAQNPPGLDLRQLGQWLPTAVPGAGSTLSATLLAGGKSNLTYAVSDGTTTWIVRRPPIGHVLATAHDMAREYRVLAALQDTEVPVPTTFALCEDPDVLGAPFYVMERVEGVPYRYTADVAGLTPQRVRMISEALVDTLGALHSVDPAEVGLADFGRPEGFLARQANRWKKQIDASRTRDLPAADELHAQLIASVPPESPAGIVHGDYRLDNVLVDAKDRPAAVIDWEMATLGDPLTDLALMLVYGRLAEAADSDLIADVSTAPGFLRENEIIERYARGSGRDLSAFGYYLALASFKLAGILEGIHCRYVRGLTVGDGFAGIGDLVVALLDSGLKSLKEHR